MDSLIAGPSFRSLLFAISRSVRSVLAPSGRGAGHRSVPDPLRTRMKSRTLSYPRYRPVRRSRWGQARPSQDHGLFVRHPVHPYDPSLDARLTACQWPRRRGACTDVLPSSSRVGPGLLRRPGRRAWLDEPARARALRCPLLSVPPVSGRRPHPLARGPGTLPRPPAWAMSGGRRRVPPAARGRAPAPDVGGTGRRGPRTAWLTRTQRSA
jgi:hypothetical protein